MKFRNLAAGISALAGAGLLLAFSIVLLRGHFQLLKDVREYALPLAAEIPPLEQRSQLLEKQMELGLLEADLRGNSAEEELNVYVLPAGGDATRLLAYLESVRTFLEKRKLLRSMSPIELGEISESDNAATGGESTLMERSIRFSAVLRPEGREHLLSILKLSGMVTVGDVLSQNDVRDLFHLTETQNYAGIVPVKQFLSADLLGYALDPTVPEARLKQAMSSEEFLSGFNQLLERSGLSSVRKILTGELGRTLAALKLWPVQFMVMQKQSVEELPDGWEEVKLEMKVYSRNQG